MVCKLLVPMKGVSFLFMISVKSKGNFSHTEKILQKALEFRYRFALEKYAKQGVDALSSVTPVDTGETASSWDYEIVKDRGSISIRWINSNIQNGVNIALILQYGHGTGTGGYVQGIDYINPALRPVFEQMADDAWKEVTSG